jgi:hypothetical protein
MPGESRISHQHVCPLLTQPDPSSPRPTPSRNRSSTITGTRAPPNPISITSQSSSHRVITEPSLSAAQTALSTLSSAKRPRLITSQTGHTRGTSWPDPPTSIPSAPNVPTRLTLRDDAKVELLLYTYRPPQLNTSTSQPSPLPSKPNSNQQVSVNYDSLPWNVKPGDYFQIRKIRRKEGKGGEASKGGARGGYVFKLGEDANVPLGQIQVSESVASAFTFQHRLEVEVVRVSSHLDATDQRFQTWQKLIMLRYASPSTSVGRTCGGWACRWRERPFTLGRRSVLLDKRYEQRSRGYGEVRFGMRVGSSPPRPRRSTEVGVHRSTCLFSCAKRPGSSTRMGKDITKKLFMVGSFGSS